MSAGGPGRDGSVTAGGAAGPGGAVRPGGAAGPFPPGGGNGQPGQFRLDVRDLKITGGRRGPVVVSEISFAVRPGEVLGLVGESGSGKTTVALALLGHTRRGLSVSGGEIRLDGVDLLRLRPGELRQARGAKVSYVAQDPSAALNPALRVGYQLREALRVHPQSTGDPQDRVLEVMREASLDGAPGMLRRYPHQLSGGQQQRVGLAMAFACRPSLIVLDEPTTGLDVSTQRHILETVRNLCRHYGVAAVYVSHDLAVVSELASDVAVMYAGRIVETGACTAVFPRPLHPYTSGLLASVPSAESAGILAGIPGQQPPPGRRGPGCSFAPRCDQATEQCRACEPEPVFVAGRTVRCLRVTAVSTGRSGLPPAAVAAAAPGPVVLSVRDLRASYGPTTALTGISLEIPAQTCVAVVGESGSGKTTLARCITGLHRDWAGEIAFRGGALPPGARQRPKPVLKQIQYVFQNPYTSLNPRKTVGQIVAEPLQRFGGLSRTEQAGRVAEVLRDVSLPRRLISRYPDQLSGGERQRVAIARALVVEPDLLVCDEVTSALDVSVQAVIVELLRSVQATRQLAMLFITHNLALVRSVAQLAVVLRQGEIIEAGPASQVLDHPASHYTARLLADAPRLASAPAGTGPAVP
jgi:peptide/nickel transport system ATP-binding protein